MNDGALEKSLHEMLRDGSVYHRAPPHLLARVRTGLPREPQPRMARFTWLALSSGGALAWAGGGLAGMALSAMILGAFTLLRPPQGDAVEQAIVSSHVRALLSQHPIDVVSTDQHTVKPWFNGRLNYAPPVTDLEAKGYPLVGGRVDYIDRRIVGVLIYRYEKHPIDLYILPATNGTSAPESHATDGYAIARWRQDGMDFWAITDAEPVHLHAFVQAFRAMQGERE